MTVNNFFKGITNRYGMSENVLRNAWDKCRMEGSTHEQHVKRFKFYLQKQQAVGSENYNIPKMDSNVTESISRVMLSIDMYELEEEVKEYINE